MSDLVVLPPNHWLWYVAQVLLGGSFIASSMLALRLLLATGFFFLLVWSAQILRISVDSVIFSGLYCCINLAQAALIVWNRRHVKFDADREQIYTYYFGPKENMVKGVHMRKWQMSRVMFNKLTEDAKIVSLRQGEFIAKHGDRCTTLSFLLSGAVSYRTNAFATGSKSSLHVHGVKNNGVIDAVEYIHRETARGAVWGIDAVASDANVRLLIIPYQSIDRVTKTDFMVEPTLSAICGVQVSSMLFNAESTRLHHLESVSANGSFDFGKSDSTAAVPLAAAVAISVTASPPPGPTPNESGVATPYGLGHPIPAAEHQQLQDVELVKFHQAE